MPKKKIRYFITQNQKGQELPHMIWSRKLNALLAMAHPAGIFISAIPEVWEALEAQGYIEVEADYCKSLRIENPQPDRVDYTVRDDLTRYTPVD